MFSLFLFSVFVFVFYSIHTKGRIVHFFSFPFPLTFPLAFPFPLTFPLTFYLTGPISFSISPLIWPKPEKPTCL